MIPLEALALLADELRAARNSLGDPSRLPDVGTRPGETLAEHLRRNEATFADEVRAALLHWLEHGAWPDTLSAGAQFWLREVSEHAYWNAQTLMAPLDGWPAFLPLDADGALAPELKSWLVFESWDFAGLPRWIADAAADAGPDGADWPCDSGAE